MIGNLFGGVIARAVAPTLGAILAALVAAVLAKLNSFLAAAAARTAHGHVGELAKTAVGWIAQEEKVGLNVLSDKSKREKAINFVLAHAPGASRDLVAAAVEAAVRDLNKTQAMKPAATAHLPKTAVVQKPAPSTTGS